MGTGGTSDTSKQLTAYPLTNRARVTADESPNPANIGLSRHRRPRAPLPDPTRHTPDAFEQLLYFRGQTRLPPLEERSNKEAIK